MQTLPLSLSFSLSLYIYQPLRIAQMWQYLKVPNRLELIVLLFLYWLPKELVCPTIYP